MEVKIVVIFKKYLAGIKYQIKSNQIGLFPRVNDTDDTKSKENYNGGGPHLSLLRLSLRLAGDLKSTMRF